MRFEYWQTGDGFWPWRLTTSLGDILAHGNPSTTRELCLTAIKRVKLAAAAGCHEAVIDDRPVVDTGRSFQPQPA